MDGLTFYVCFGKGVGFNWYGKFPLFRIVLGYISIVIVMRDLERDFVRITNYIKKLKKREGV